jgi:DNA (cytosine-5)-methyltransferase 1
MLFNGQGRPLNPDGWSSTLPASMGGNRTPIVDEEHLYKNSDSWVERYHALLMRGESATPELDVPKRLRRLTIDEVAILQGFPNDYIFIGSQSKVYSQIGNAVPCTLAAAVAATLRDMLLGLKKQQSHTTKLNS